MKKIKKILSVVLACTAIMGMTLTASASHSTHNWRVITPSVNCAKCGHTCAIRECTMEVGAYHYGCSHGHSA